MDVREAGLTYRIRPAAGLAVGLYLDMREARTWLRAQARGRTVLNCFAYTCGFAVAARAGGAARVAQRRPQPPLARLGRGERAAQWTASRARPTTWPATSSSGSAASRARAERFEVVILDPPGFARSHAGTFSAARDWPRLAAAAAEVVAPGGILLAACNVAALDGRRFDAALAAGIRRGGRSATDLARPGASPIDFPTPRGEEPPLKVRALRLGVVTSRSRAMIQPSPRRGGLRFGKYVLLDRLAVGGMAEIFLARQEGVEGFEKTVVIKRIRPHLSKRKSFVSMFLDEARLAAQLNHPNIVQIHELGQLDDSYFIAMEYVFGRDMARIIPKAEKMGIAFPAVYALKIAAEVCEGLHYAHQRSDAWGNPLHIVHRDVTPENVFVSFDGTVKILDFGIAKARGQSGETSVGEIKGKLSYLSPEQALGKPLDCRSDIFSLGVVLYEWLTGLRLFTGDSEAAVLRSITEGKIYGPSYFKPDIPSEVEAVVMRALDKDRERRYASAWEMQRDLGGPALGERLPPLEHAPGELPQAALLRRAGGRAGPPHPDRDPAGRCHLPARRRCSGSGSTTPTGRPWRRWPSGKASRWRSWPGTCCVTG